MMQRYALIVLGILAALGMSYEAGRRTGKASEAAAQAQELAQLQAQLFKVGEDLSRKTAALEDLRASQGTLAQELEDEARKDPDGVRPGIGADGLRRLERRWQSQD